MYVNAHNLNNPDCNLPFLVNNVFVKFADTCMIQTVLVK